MIRSLFFQSTASGRGLTCKQLEEAVLICKEKAAEIRMALTA